MENKRKEFNKLTNETIKNQEDSKKRNSDAALFREEKRIQDDTNRLLKSEILKDDTNFVDAYSNTPSSAKISKSRSLSLTNSTYSTKLLEKLVQGQTDNEFTRATLAYQESSLKLLEEIKQTISELKPKEMEKGNKEDDSLEREVSSLANSIAQLDIPSLYKELKRTSIRMFDKTGITDTFAMLYEMMAGSMGDRSEMINMFKGKIKNGVLNKAFGKNMAQMINKFEEDPMEMIQDFINMKANSSNQFFRTLFGKHASAIEIKKASDRRNDAEDFKALNDKLTYNTINYRLPESLDRIEAAITGNVKRSYDYSTNRYLTDEERMRDFIGSGKHFDLRSASEQLLDDLKESLSDLFDSGSISKDVLKEYLVFDNSKNELKRGSDNRYIFRDELAMNDLLLQIHKSKVDLTMMYDNNFSAENFIKNNNIKLSNGISKQQQINAANTLHQILMNNGYNAMKDFSESLDDNKRSASNVDIMDTHYAMFTPEQIALAKSFREGEISYETFKTLLEESGSSGSSNSSSRRRISRISRASDDLKKNFKYRVYNSNIVHEDMTDPERKMKDLEDYQKRSKNGSDVVYNGSKTLKGDEHLNKLRLLLNNDLRDTNYYKDKFGIDINSSSGFKINDFMKKNIDEDMIKFEKATELYTKFLNAKMTPQTLSATTGQSYDYFKNAGYPTCPADLFKYITINEQGEAEVDYDSLSKLNTQFSKEYVEALSKRYKIDTKGIDTDITDPGKTTSNILNEMFRDPTVLKSMGMKSGGAAGFLLGKMLQNKGIISSPLAPYLMGGLGAAIMNMQSVQNRMNMILGPEGDIKGKSGFTNREIAMAKFMNKTLPRIGLGGFVAKNFYKMFAGSGALGTGIGIIGGGTLGLLTAAIAPSLMKFGREKLFGDDGEGNKGVLKSIGGLLRNIPWVEKYLSLNIKKEDSNDTLVSYATADLEREVEDRIRELEETAPKDSNGNFMNPEDKVLHETLLEFGKNLKYNKERLLKDKSGSLARKTNESDEAYINRVQKYVTEKVVGLAENKSKGKLVDDKKQLVTQQVESIASGFKTNLDEKIMRRDTLANIEGDLADLDYDKDVGKRSLDKTIMKIANNKERKEAMEFFKEVEEADGKDFYDKMINTIINRVDEDGSRKEKAREFKKFMDITRTENADEALSVLLGDDRIKLLREGKIDEFKDSFYETVKDKDGNDIRKLKEDDELFELFETISELGTLSEDYLSQDEIDMIRKMALIKARSLSKNPDDPSVYTRADEITRSILNKLNKKTLSNKIDDSTRNTIGKIKEAFAKLTGDVGVMDGEDAEKEKEVFSLFRKYNIMDSDFVKEGLNRKAKRDQADLDDKLNNSTEGSGSGLGASTKMFNLKKYKFKNGKTLDLTGCSVATLNNMLISLDLGSINIEELIKIANNHLSDTGAVKDSFFDEMTQRLGLTLKVYNKNTTKFSKSFFKSIKPSSKRGVIILKDNPNLPYGHFILMKSISGNNIIIDDPELRGIKTYSFADLISLSNSVYVFDIENETIESKEVRTIKKKIKDRTGIDLNRSIIDNVKDFLKPKNKNTETPIVNNTNIEETASSTPTGNDTITSLLEKIYDYITNGILNIRIVDDVMMPLKVSDGSMSKVLGDGRNRVNLSDPTALTKFYDKMRLNPASKEEFAKADAVQDAIINGTGLGAGTGSLDIDKKPEVSESEIKKMGGIGGIIGSLIGDGLGLIGEGAGIVGGWKLLKSKLFKTAAKEGTEEVVEQTTKKGIKGVISSFFKKKGKDKVIQEMTEKTLKETGEQGVKFLPKVANTMKSFFATIFEKSPKILKRYTGKLVKTVSPFIDNFVSAFGKFMKSSKGLIEKKLAKNTAKGIGMKVPYLNIAIGIGTFLWAFYDGYKNANELIGSNEDLNMLTKIAIGFAKGVAIALPGLVLSSVNGFVGAAFEIYMELHGFKALVQWFLESNDESENSKIKSQETKNNSEEINKEEINKEDRVTQQTKSSASIAEIAKTMENTTPSNKSSDGSGDLNLSDELNIDNKSKSFITKEDKAKYNSLTNDYEKHLENEKSKKSSGMGILEKLVLNNFKTNGSYLHPLGDPNRTINSVFGPRNYTGASKNHKGIDFAGNFGDSVYAVAAGTVIYADDRWGYVRIKHPDGTSSGYMHMDSIAVKVGDQVLPGQVIGTVGGRGRTKSGSFSRTAYSPHLHFDFQNKTKDGEDPFRNSNKVDPFPILGLDPNVIKLAPKNKALENIDYLSKHKNLLSQLNSDNKATYDKSTAKGGPDDPIVNSTNLLTNVIGELNTNIKGLNINNNSSSSDITALASTELIKLMVQMNQSIQSLIQITASQSAILERVVSTINGLKIDPSDIRAANMSRIGTF